mgnify:CR=1 FL=1
MARVFSGIKPTGGVHLGNHLGALQNWVSLQDRADAVYCVVDLHALTVPHDPDELRTATLSLAQILMAIGLDPDRCTLFVQSHVHEHSECAWIMECTAAFGELRRMTQFKDKSEGSDFVSGALFTYPALQASDILLYDTNQVPVGEDQRQHIELTRDIAVRFNNRYGDTFVVPEAVIPEAGARVMDLQHPTAKMSKSDESPQGTVLLLDEPTNHLDIISIRWLEIFLKEFKGPVVVISHDHRFLDNVMTHVLDVDYETVLLYHGNYSDSLVAKQLERERREKDIAARERDIAHHQKFVDRFRAKASKARQAQSKVRMIEKKAAALTQLPMSSRRYPTFRFEQKRDSGKEVLRIKGIKKAFGDNEVLHGVDLTVNRGDRLAIMGPNGIGKSTLLKIIMGELQHDAGEVEWGYETHPGYFAQDRSEQFKSPTRTAEDWVWDFCPDKDLGFVRGRMGLMLFSGDEGKKRLSALSGGEAARLIFTKLALELPNVLVLDEPTNHLDLESIEALVEGLKAFPGTLILVSHDRWFVSGLATRIIEIKPEEVRDYHGTYEEYVHFCGDDHLDADRVILKAKRDKKAKSKADRARAAENGSEGVPAGGRKRVSKAQKNRMGESLDTLMARIDNAEARVAEIDELFCQPGYYEQTPPDDVRELEDERSRLKGEVADLTSEWERTEEELSALR